LWDLTLQEANLFIDLIERRRTSQGQAVSTQSTTVSQWQSL
jgi:hypothetical protein